jgi:hypothetical protein
MRDNVMTLLQRLAWIEAGFWSAATLLFFALLLTVGPGPAPAAFAVIGLLPVASSLVRRRSEARGLRPLFDERDREISARASRHAFAVSYVVFVLGIVGLQQYALRAGGCAPASGLMAVLWLAIALQVLVRTSSVIGQSRSQETDDDG